MLIVSSSLNITIHKEGNSNANILNSDTIKDHGIKIYRNWDQREDLEQRFWLNIIKERLEIVEEPWKLSGYNDHPPTNKRPEAVE